MGLEPTPSAWQATELDDQRRQKVRDFQGLLSPLPAC